MSSTRKNAKLAFRILSSVEKTLRKNFVYRGNAENKPDIKTII